MSRKFKCDVLNIIIIINFNGWIDMQKKLRHGLFNLQMIKRNFFIKNNFDSDSSDRKKMFITVVLDFKKKIDHQL